MWRYLGVVALLSVMGMGQTWAQAYPSKPVRVIIPFAPGGGTDVLARPLVLKLGDALKQHFLYENRGGGNSIIGAEAVAKSPPDGYTLLLCSSGALVLNVGLYEKLPYDPIRDFAPITMIAIAPNVLVVKAALPATSVQQLIAYAKANPGKLNWAGSGGGAASLAMELFRLTADLSMVAVSYKGAGPAVTAVIAGEADLMFANAGVFLPHLKTGRVRALGVSSLQRLAILPDIPTIDESGMKGFEGSTWYGLVAPAGTPAPAIATLHAETAKLLKTSEFISRFATEGAIPVGNTPEQFAAELKREIPKWTKIIKAAGIKAE